MKTGCSIYELHFLIASRLFLHERKIFKRNFPSAVQRNYVKIENGGHLSSKKDKSCAWHETLYHDEKSTQVFNSISSHAHAEMGNIHQKSILYTIYRYSQIFVQNIQYTYTLRIFCNYTMYNVLLPQKIYSVCF